VTTKPAFEMHHESLGEDLDHDLVGVLDGISALTDQPAQ